MTWSSSTALNSFFFFFFNDTATTEIYTLSLHDALPISGRPEPDHAQSRRAGQGARPAGRSEEHTSELQSLRHLVCRLLLEKKKTFNAGQSLVSRTWRLKSLDSRLHNS